MTHEYRPINEIPFERILDGHLEKHGINVICIKDNAVARLVGPTGTLTATRAGTSTHFERSLNVDVESILCALALEFDTDIVDENHHRFWGFSTKAEMLALFSTGKNSGTGQADHSTQWVLVEGPSWGDADFTKRWLQSAINADGLLEAYVSSNPSFRKKISRLEIVTMVEFAPTAMAYIRLWLKDGNAFAFDLLDSEWAEIFVTMVDLGFFRLTGERYQMTIPGHFEISALTDSLLRLAATEDADYLLHPENLLTTMNFEQVFIWQERLNRMNWRHRLADREALLSG